MHRVALGLFALLVAGAVSAAELRPFDGSSLDSIQRAHAGKPFVLALWSLTCDTCREKMPQWGELQSKYPTVPIVLIATDPPAERAAVSSFLSKHKLGNVQLWSFADDFTERLRFAVDRHWRGELPRTYLYNADGTRRAITGALDARSLEEWITSQQRGRP